MPERRYELSQGQLVVTRNLTLTGAGSGKTKLDGTLSTRIFDIASGRFAYIGGVTLQWSLATPGFLGHVHGGAIHNHGTLVLEETIQLILSSPSGGTLGTLVSATLTIADDDGAPAPGPSLDQIVALPLIMR